MDKIKKKKKLLELKLLVNVARVKDLCLPIYSVWQAEHSLLASWSLGLWKRHSDLRWLVWRRPSMSQSHMFSFSLLVMTFRPVSKWG